MAICNIIDRSTNLWDTNYIILILLKSFFGTIHFDKNCMCPCSKGTFCTKLKRGRRHWFFLTNVFPSLLPVYWLYFFYTVPHIFLTLHNSPEVLFLSIIFVFLYIFIDQTVR